MFTSIASLVNFVASRHTGTPSHTFQPVFIVSSRRR